MARKVLDIMPPYQKATHHHPGLKKKKEKKKALMVFVLIIFFLLFFALLAGLYKFDTSINSKTSSQNSTNSFELFNEQGQSNLTAGQTAISVRLLDGSSNADTLRTTRDLLLKNGYEIEQTDQAASSSSQTIIYYPQANLQKAQKIAEILKNYNPKLQESQANSNYDILILIGGQ